MDVCKSCHEKDKRVTQCKAVMPMHIKYTGFVTKCEICGQQGTIYVCGAYEINREDYWWRIKTNENMSSMPR